MANDAGAEERLLTVCLLGGTGTGKSSTGNSLFKRNVYQVGTGVDSQTSEPDVKIEPWRDDGPPFRCVDLPGLGDSYGRDREQLDHMAEVLRDEVKYVNAFLLVLRSLRFDSYLQNMLKKFRDVFGEEFLRNVVVVFTHWNFRKAARRRREKNGEDEHFWAKEINEALRKLLGHEFDCKCVFMDNSLTALSEEELEDEFEGQLPEVQRAVEEQVHSLRMFMLSREPFFCCGIDAVLAEKEDIKQRFNTMLPMLDTLDTARLGRQLISADNDFIRGWLRLRKPPGPPQRLWAVLRRQHLELFTDETQTERAGPKEIALLQSVCGKDGWFLLSGQCFLIYKPRCELSQKDGVLRPEERYSFGVEPPAQLRQWMLLVQEATQHSESWSRIHQFHEGLHLAESLAKYVLAIKKVATGTMVIPMEWVRHSKSRSEDETSSPPSSFTASSALVDWQQTDKDLRRDKVSLDGRLLKQPSALDLVADVALRLLQWTRPRRPDDSQLETKVFHFAREIVSRCSRTDGNGDTLDAVRLLFQKDLVHTLVDQGGETEPIKVSILRPDGSEGVLQKDFLHCCDSLSGLPQFVSDASAADLGMDKVRGMCTEFEQRLQVTLVSRDAWVPDWDMLQCMKCGVQFGIWVRRHHCRHCGALVCASCSQHSIELCSPSADPETQVRTHSSAARVGRVCFACYQKAVINDLSKRKETARPLPTLPGDEAAGADTDNIAMQEDPPGPGDEAAGADTEDIAVEGDPPGRGDSFGSSGVNEEDDFWPVVSVEMASRYILCDDDKAELFVLHCKHVRQIRWNGVIDDGRVLISVEQRMEVS